MSDFFSFLYLTSSVLIRLAVDSVVDDVIDGTLPPTMDPFAAAPRLITEPVRCLTSPPYERPPAFLDVGKKLESARKSVPSVSVDRSDS